MVDSILFNSPIMIIGFVVAFVIALADFKANSSGYVFTVISCCIAVAMIAYSLVMGATLQEVLIVVLIFFLFNASVFIRRGRGSK